MNAAPYLAIFEFGRGFYRNMYTPMLSGLTLTPGPPQIFCNWKSWAGLGMKLTNIQQPVAVWLGWLMIVNFLITLANETFTNIIFDDG